MPLLHGAGVGVVNWGVGEAVSALARTTKGPNDNWCYMKSGRWRLVPPDYVLVPAIPVIRVLENLLE